MVKLVMIITKFVVRKTLRNTSVPVSHYDKIEKAINEAKFIYKNHNAELLGYEVTVEESRFADEKRLKQDVAIDRHIRWASYFDEF